MCRTGRTLFEQDSFVAILPLSITHSDVDISRRGEINVQACCEYCVNNDAAWHESGSRTGPAEYLGARCGCIVVHVDCSSRWRGVVAAKRQGVEKPRRTLDGGIARDEAVRKPLLHLLDIVRHILTRHRGGQGDLIGIVGGIGGVHPSTRGEEYWDGETFTNGWSCHYSVTSSTTGVGWGCSTWAVEGFSKFNLRAALALAILAAAAALCSGVRVRLGLGAGVCGSDST